MTLDEKTQEQAAFEHHMLVLEQEMSAWRESTILWRHYVITRSEAVYRKYRAAIEHHKALMDREQEVRAEWKRVAYPLNDFPLDDESKAS